jgi:hypothetical protein
MTVKDLIAELQKHDPLARVEVDVHEAGFITSHEIEVVQYESGVTLHVYA